MNQKILIGWAGGASAIALVLLGVVIGRTTGPASPRAAGGYDASSVDTSSAHGTGAPAAPAAPAFTVPDIFKDMPSDWRTDTDSETFDGYAILFDPQRREVIVEQCRHRGYVDDNGTPRDTNYEFCDGVLWANILDLGDNAATVQVRTGEVIDLDLELAADGKRPLLSLSFPDHDMVLIPGSKNDLLQAMDKTPRMIEEKQKQFEALQAAYRERRRAQQAALREKAEDLPSYTLPQRQRERDKDSRPLDPGREKAPE